VGIVFTGKFRAMGCGMPGDTSLLNSMAVRIKIGRKMEISFRGRGPGFHHLWISDPYHHVRKV
jgi:hypothetical protein